MHPIAVVLILVVAAIIIVALYDHYYVPWNAKRMVYRIMSPKDKIDPRALEDSKYGRISCDSFGLSVKTKNEEVRMEWAWIEEIHAYKIDLFTTDMICLSLFSHTRKLAIEIREEMAGYHDTLTFLEKFLPSYSSTWLSDVAFPAFVENRKLIWKRKTEPNQSSTDNNYG